MTVPTLVQMAVAESGTTVTLPAAPTPGNLLVLIRGSGAEGASTAAMAGFDVKATALNDVGTAFFRRTGSVQTRTCQAGDSASLTGAAMVYILMEFANAAWGGIVAADSQTAYGIHHQTCGGPFAPAAGVDAKVYGVAGVRQGNGEDATHTSTPDAGWTQDWFTPDLVWNLPQYIVLHKDVTAASGSYTPGSTMTLTGAGAGTSYFGFTFAITGAAAPAGGVDVIKIEPPGDATTALTELDDAYDVSVRVVRNEPGTGSLKLKRSSPHATAEIIAPGNMVSVRFPELGPNYLFTWFMEQGNFKLVSTAEAGGEVINVAGRGALAYWERAIWLSQKFAIPWWPAGVASPPAGARGLIRVKAGTYKRFNVSGGVITSMVSTGAIAAFDAYFDERRTFLWPSADDKRFLVHIMTGQPHAGWYFHPHQAGVQEILPSYAIGSSVPLSTIGTGTKPGQVLERMYREGKDPARPTHPIPLMTINFTDTLDSAGNAWNTSDALAALTAQLGETYLGTVAKVLSTGAVDVEMSPGLLMQAWNSQGVDRSGASFDPAVVRFEKGVNIVGDLVRERADVPVATFIEVVGQENVIGQASLPDAATLVARETSATGDSGDSTVLSAAGLADLTSRRVDSDAIGFEFLIGNDPSTGRYLPKQDGHFWLGDVVRVHTGIGNQDLNERNMRVSAITYARGVAGKLRGFVELGGTLGKNERSVFGVRTAAPATFITRSQYSDTLPPENPHPDLAEHDAIGLATDAELAITDAAVAAHLADAVDAHDASAVSIVDAGAYYAGADVEAALQEIGAGGIGGGGGGGASAFVGARVYKAAAETVTAGVETAMTFDSEERDPDGFHESVTNPTRFTVPAGMDGPYFVRAHVGFPGSHGAIFARLKKNGATFIAGSEDDLASGTDSSLWPSALVDLVAGDYIEVWAYRTTGTTVGAATSSFSNTFEIFNTGGGGGGGGPVTVLSDTFNRANGAVGDADGGPFQHWLVSSGTWEINSNRLRETSAASERFIYVHTGWLQPRRTIVWTLNTKPTSGDGGLVMRASTVTFLLLNVEATYKLYTFSGGSFSAVTATSGTPVAPADGDVITIDDDGARLSVSVNGGAAVIYDTFVNGGPYMGFRNSGGGGMTHDSIVVTETDGGDGGGGADAVKTSPGAGAVYVPGLRGAVQRIPASPSAFDDEFEALTGWSTLGTLDIDNVTDYPSHWHGKRTQTGRGVNGKYKACPSLPFTVTIPLTEFSTDNQANNPGVGLMVLDASATALMTFGPVAGSGFGANWYDIFRGTWTNRTTLASNSDSNGTGYIPHMAPTHIRMVVNSSTSVDLEVSDGGRLWVRPFAAVNPGFTIANVGICLFILTGTSYCEFVTDSIRFT